MIIKILKMTIEDLENIKEILEKNFDDFWNYNILNKELLKENSYFLVAKNENEDILGFVGVEFILDEVDITNIVIKKEYRNLKIGTKLLECLIKDIKEKNKKSITLEVNENNIYAIKLYKKFNFEIAGQRKKYYNGKDTALIMTLNI